MIPLINKGSVTDITPNADGKPGFTIQLQYRTAIVFHDESVAIGVARDLGCNVSHNPNWVALARELKDRFEQQRPNKISIVAE